MKKHLLLILLLLILFILNGCNINNLNKDNDVTLTDASQMKQLIGVTYDDIQKTYGLPETATYYLNSNNISLINKKYLSLRDFHNFSIIKAYYKVSSDNYIILWYKNNKIIDVYTNNSSYLKNKNLINEVNNSDVKIEFFKDSSLFDLENQNIISLKSQNINKLTKKYNLSYPQFKIHILKNNEIIYIYNSINNTYIFLYCDRNNNILKYDILNHSQIHNKIIEYMKKMNL